MADRTDKKPDEHGASGPERRRAFLGFVAHEVRNPLSTALWSAELLGRITAEERGGPRGEKLSAMCLRSISRVRQLVEDHFLCERLDSGGIPLRAEPVVVREAAEAVVERRPADVGEIALDVAAGVVLHADRTLLERALDALVATAGREGTAVRIASEPRGRALALPLVRRIAAALGGSFALSDGGRYVLTLPRPDRDAARPDPAAHP